LHKQTSEQTVERTPNPAFQQRREQNGIQEQAGAPQLSFFADRDVLELIARRLRFKEKREELSSATSFRHHSRMF